jgi:hypothetical protein
MKRQWVVVGVGVLGLVLFALVAAVLAAPGHPRPLLQQNETEPNNDFASANSISLGSVTGVVTRSTDTRDYFIVGTTVGRGYRASLTVVQNPGAMPLRLRVYNSSTEEIPNSPSASSSSYTTFEWTALQGTQYIVVELLPPPTTTLLVANYWLDIVALAATPTPSNTPPPGADPYEPNNSRTQAYMLPVATSATAAGANFYPPGDEDWFGFYVKAGRYYRASTANLSGVDTFLELYHQDGTLLRSDNDGGGGFASLIEWQAAYDGYYYLRVTNRVTSSSNDRYDLTIAEISAPPTATPGPSPTPIAGYDACENNYDFDHACIIAPNQPQTFNLISPFGGPDNDFFRLWVKPGLIFDCRTSDLGPGVDPNMIVYDANRNALGGNDDVTPGDYNSAFSYYATYEGWLFILIGTGNRTPPNPANSNYTLRCDSRLPGQPTTTPGKDSAEEPVQPAPTRTPMPAGAPATPVPGLTVRLLTTPTPPALRTPVPRFVPVEVLIYYDSNSDGQPGAGEGIRGVSVQARDAMTNQLLAQGFTDEQGHLVFSVSAKGPLRVSVPFFGFSQLVAGESAQIYLRVPAQAPLGGTS